MNEPGPHWERGGSCTDDNNCFDEGISYGDGEMEIQVEAGEGAGTNQQSCRSRRVSSLLPDRGVTRRVWSRQERKTNISSRTTTTPTTNAKQSERENKALVFSRATHRFEICDAFTRRSTRLGAQQALLFEHERGADEDAAGNGEDNADDFETGV